MSLRRETPCDFGPCPYDSETNDCCEYWCGADEPQDYPEAWECGVDKCPEVENDFWIRTTEEEQPRNTEDGWETVVDELSTQNPNWIEDLPF